MVRFCGIGRQRKHRQGVRLNIFEADTSCRRLDAAGNGLSAAFLERYMNDKIPFEPEKLKKVVNRRNHIRTFEGIIDQHLPEFQRAMDLNDEQMAATRIALGRLLERVFTDMSDAAILGSTNGMKQALALMMDSEMYKIDRKRRESRNPFYRMEEKSKGKQVLDGLLGTNDSN